MTTTPRKKITPSAAYAPAPWEPADAKALQQMAIGEATPEQQKRALKWIVEQAAATYDQPFRPGDNGETQFACGRMFVGQQIVKLVKVDLLALQRKQGE